MCKTIKQVKVIFDEFLTYEKSPKTHQYVVASLPVNIVLYKSFTFSIVMIQFSRKPIPNMSSANDNKGPSVWSNVYSNFKVNSRGGEGAKNSQKWVDISLWVLPY